MSGCAVAADIAPQLARAASAAKRGDHAGGREAIEQARKNLHLDAALMPKPFMAVTRPAQQFGDFDARRCTEFGQGEVLNFYFEPNGNLRFGSGFVAFIN